MFGIGMPEMLVLLAVALIVFGPKKLPQLAKSLGRALGEFKRATSDLKDSIETETGANEVRGAFKDVKEDIKSQVDLAGSVPDPSEPSEPSESSAYQTHDDPSDEDSMDQVKSAFDEMNADTDADESHTDPPADQDPSPEDTPKS